jgi:hypothetical protein
MQWILQEFEDTRRLAEVLTARGLPWSFHKVVPFEGSLIPEPQIADPRAVVLFGSYAMRHFAAARGLWPGVMVLRPFLDEAGWRDHLLNGPDALILSMADLQGAVVADDRDWFMRPVEDSKAEPGRVRTGAGLHALAAKVLALDPADIPPGSLAPDTEVILSRPRSIVAEWRIWIVRDRVVTWSLYRRASGVVYLPEIDEDALAFAKALVAANPAYAEAYVMDICRAEDRLWLLETNCLNAAGFYAADLGALVEALEGLAAS